MSSKKQAPIIPRPDLFIVPKSAQPRQYVTIKETGQRGYIWQGRSICEQVARGKIGVIIDDWTGPMLYFRPDELKEETHDV